MEEGKFVVRQSAFFNFLSGIIYLVIFIGVVFTIRGQGAFDTGDYFLFAAMFFIPSLALFFNAIKRRQVLQIDNIGIYQNKTLITKWDRFIQANIFEVDPNRGTSINFSLYVEYYHPETNVSYEITIPLSGTLDKSNEEIIEAIEVYKDANV